MNTLKIPSIKKYVPYPTKKDGFITIVMVTINGRNFTKTYRGKLTKYELPEYINTEYSDCNVLVSALAYYEFKEADSIDKIFSVK